MAFSSFLDAILGPLLDIPAFWGVLLLSLLVSLIITLIYKYTTDQNLMKQLKAEIKELQKEAKELRHNPQEAMKVQKKMMETNMKYMTKSMKSTIITFIPIILIFTWMNANFAYEPIKPNQDFTATVFFKEGSAGTIELLATEQLNVQGETKKEIKDGKVSWILNGQKGEHLLEFRYNGEEQTKKVIIDGKKYSDPVEKIKDSSIKSIEIEHEKKLIMNLFGWKLGWLGTYIIFSIVFSMGLRKLLKIY